MPSNPTRVVIDVTSDTSAAVAGMDDVTASARAMAREVDDAGRAAADSSRKLGVTADAADELGGKAGKATGALGALSSGFELVGAEKYATGLQAAGMATDFFSGVGDSLNLVMESTILKTARAKVATVAHAIATKAAAVGTGIMTAAQWALNAAMSANPIALVVIAVVALVAGLVLLYKKSDRARAIMQAIGKVGASAIRGVVNVVRDVVGWVGDRLPGAFSKAKAVIVTAVKLYTLPIRTLLTVIQFVIAKIGKLPGAMSAAKDKLVDLANKVLAPFRKLRDLIDSVLDKISKIKLPDVGGGIPFVNGIRALAGTGSTQLGRAPVAAGGDTFNIVVNGALDPDAVARQIEKVLTRNSRRFRLVTA